MGCPAKKVCNKWAGSALMQDEPLALAIVAGGGRGVRAARRAGHAEDAHRLVRRRNATRCASRALSRAPASQMLTVHGRTREQGYSGARRIRHHRRGEGRGARSRWSPTATSTRPRRRATCWRATGADAVMIGRAAQGRPWIFREIAHFLATGDAPGAAAGGRSAAAAARAPAGPLRAVRRIHRRAQRAQAHRLVRARRCPAARRSARSMNLHRGLRGRSCAAVADFFDALAERARTGCRAAGDASDCANEALTQSTTHEQEAHRRMRARRAWRAISGTCAAPSPTACTRCWSRWWRSRCSKS